MGDTWFFNRVSLICIYDKLHFFFLVQSKYKYDWLEVKLNFENIMLLCSLEELK